MKQYTLLSIVLLTLAGSAQGMENPAQNLEYYEYEPARDLAEINKIAEENWSSIYIGKPYDPKIVDYLMSITPETQETCKKSYVIRSGTSTIGFVNCYISKANKSVYLDTGALAKEYQNKRLGTLYFAKILELAQSLNLKHVGIDVAKNNASMLSICQKNGFEITSDTVLGGKAYELVKKL